MRNKITNFKEYEESLGTMYHLILDTLDPLIVNKIRFVDNKDFPTYLGSNGNPIVYLHLDKIYLVAEDFTIIYPKVYIKRSRPLKESDDMKRYRLH